MKDFFWILFWTLSTWSSGAFILKSFYSQLDDDFPSRAFAIALRFAAGLTAYSFFWYALGVLGWIGFPALIVWVCVSGVLVIGMRREFMKAVRSLAQGTKQFLALDPAVRPLFLLTAALIFITGLRCWSSYVDGDSLVYHLYLPKLWSLMGAIGNFNYSEHAYWPSFLEVCFIPAELIGSVAASKIVSFALYFLLVVSVGAYVFNRTRNACGAMVASSILASVPFFFRHAPSTYNDIAFGFFATLALIVWGFGLARQEGASGWRFGVLSGLLMGVSLSCKYIGFYALFALCGACFLEFLFRQKAFCTNMFAGFLSGTLATGFPYYLRSYLHYHNPVFPFAQKIFNTPFGYGSKVAGWISPNMAHEFVGTGTGFLDFVMLPVNLIFHPGVFGGEKVGFFFLLLLPLIFLNFKTNRLFLFFCFIYTGIWFFLYQGTRYLTPVFAVLAMVIGTGWAAYVPARPKLFRALRYFVVTGLIVFNLWAAYYAYKDFFRNNNDSLKQVSAHINAKIPSWQTKVFVVGEERIYYYDFIAIRERAFRNFTFFPRFTSDKVRQLLQQEGVSCLLLVSRGKEMENLAADATVEFDAYAYFRDFIKQYKMEKLGEWKSLEGVRYQLYQFSDVGA